LPPLLRLGSAAGKPGSGRGRRASGGAATLHAREHLTRDRERSGSAPGSRFAGRPFRRFNRKMFSVHEKAEPRPIYRPASMGYKHIVPKPLRDGVRNILSLLTEPFIAMANFLLQGKPSGKMAKPSDAQ
jgi:phospholipid-binding lipoprotein MlaA